MITGTEARTATVRGLLQQLSPHRRTLTVIIVLSLLSAGCGLAQPLVVQQIINHVGTDRLIAGAVALLICLITASALLDASRQYLLGRCGEQVVLAVRTNLTSHLLKLPVRDLDQRRDGDLISRVTTDTVVLRAALTGGLVDAVSGGVVLVGSIVAMSLINPLLLGGALVVIVVAVVVIGTASSRIQPLTQAAQEAVGQLTADTGRALAAIRTLRAFGATGQAIEQLSVSTRTAFDRSLAVERIRAVLEPAAGLAVQTALLVVLGLGGYQVASGQTTIAELVTFVLFLFTMLTPVSQGFQAVITVRTSLGALARIEEITDLPGEEAHDTVVTPLMKLRCPGRSHLRLSGVSFAYEPGRPVLDRVDIDVPAGSTTAIVGLSGSGKSTVLALIERFYELDAGTISLDGVDIRELARPDLRARLGYVEQDAPVLAGTLRSNLLLAVPTASDDDLRRVLSAVSLLGLIERNPRGLDAEIGDGGVGLSGGERQRLGIARVLLARPSLLLLDEPTSALDSRSEQTVRQAIDAIGGQTTIIVVAHRLATVREATQIVLLDQGRVRAVGMHDELMRDDLYRELAAFQLIQ